MKKAKTRTPKKRDRKISPLTLFAGGLTSIFMMYAIGKKQDDPALAPLPPAGISSDAPNCAPAFALVSAQMTRQAIGTMIEIVESPSMGRIQTIHTAAAHYAHSYGYDKPQFLEEGSNSNLTKRLSRDLRMLLHYHGSITKEFSSAIADGLKSFQFYHELPQTGQADVATLSALSQEMAASELRIALYATQTAMKYGMSPRELLLLVSAESNNDPMAQAGTSSALGLGQFLEDTWIELMGRYGGKVGYEHYAKDAKSLIAARDAKRGLSRAEKITRDHILEMRKDLGTSIEMIALYGLEVTGGKFTAKNAYAGYFLGPGDFARYMANPNADASKISPQAAGANQRIYFKKQIKRQVMAKDKKGHLRPVKGKFEMVWTEPRTAAEVIDIITAKVTDEQRGGDVARMLANVQAMHKTLALEAQAGVQNVKCAPSIVPDQTPQNAGRMAAIQVN